MLEINSFNELLFAAKTAKIRLHNLSEDNHGFWTCAWWKDGQTFPSVERRLPFNALHDAFILARDAKTSADEELFG